MFSGFRKKYIGDRAFYGRCLRLVIPMIIQAAITAFVNLLDNVMVGRLGTEPMSGVAIVNQLLFVYNLTVFGAVSAAGIFGAQFFGNGDHKGHMYSFRFRLYLALLFSVVVIGLFQAAGSPLIGLYLSESDSTASLTDTLRFGRQYMDIMCVGLLPFALTQAYGSAVKETGHSFVPMLAGLVAVFTNLLLNWLLIFGVGPFPALGVRGAAIATVISRFAEAALIVIWAHHAADRNLYLQGAYAGFGVPKALLGQIFRKGMPLMVNELLWSAGMTFVSQCYSVRGLDVVAAYNINSTISNLFGVVYLQFGMCISIMLGQRLGAGELEAARDEDNKLIALALFICVCVAVVMFLLCPYLPKMYNTSDEIRALAVRFLHISACCSILHTLVNSYYFTIRSGGKTVITFLFDSGYTWVVYLPVAFCLVHFTNLPIITVFLLVNLTDIIKVVIGTVMVRSGMWLVKIV